MLKRLVLVVILIGIAVAVVHRIGSLRLPVLMEGAVLQPTGVFHVHSENSHDSKLSLSTIARAAASLGHRFVILTDHNARLARSTQVESVTLVSSPELSLLQGHLIALGDAEVPSKTQREQAETVQRLKAEGALPIVAHPADRKRPWQGSYADIAGLEIVNVAAAARFVGGPAYVGLLPLAVAWRIRPTAALAGLYVRDEAALKLWDKSAPKDAVGLCGVDAHGRIDVALNLQMWHLVLHQPDTLQPMSEDALLQTLARGRFHCVAGLIARNPHFAFNVVHHGQPIASAGDTVAAAADMEIVVEGPQRADGGEVILVLLRDGLEVRRTASPNLVYRLPDPGLYRVEVLVEIPSLLFGSRQTPVMYSNRIHIGDPITAPQQPPPQQP